MVVPRNDAWSGFSPVHSQVSDSGRERRVVDAHNPVIRVERARGKCPRAMRPTTNQHSVIVREHEPIVLAPEFSDGLVRIPNGRSVQTMANVPNQAAPIRRTDQGDRDSFLVVVPERHNREFEMLADSIRAAVGARDFVPPFAEDLDSRNGFRLANATSDRLHDYAPTRMRFRDYDPVPVSQPNRTSAMLPSARTISKATRAALSFEVIATFAVVCPHQSQEAPERGNS
jgi:hypothetical protein